MNPKNRVSVVIIKALPVSKKVFSKAASLSNPVDLQYRYFPKKWMVSSTAIPNTMANTIEIEASSGMPKTPTMLQQLRVVVHSV